MTDELRLRELQRGLQLLQTVAAILLMVHSAVGGAISGLPALTERLKKMSSVLLEGMHSQWVQLLPPISTTITLLFLLSTGPIA